MGLFLWGSVVLHWSIGLSLCQYHTLKVFQITIWLYTWGHISSFQLYMGSRPGLPPHVGIKTQALAPIHNTMSTHVPSVPTHLLLSFLCFDILECSFFYCEPKCGVFNAIYLFVVEGVEFGVVHLAITRTHIHSYFFFYFCLRSLRTCMRKGKRILCYSHLFILTT